MIKIPANRLAQSLLVALSVGTANAASVADNRVDLGIEALKSGDYNTAKQWLESAISRQTTHPDLANALGLTYLGLGKNDMAEHYFKQALATARRHEAAYHLGKLALDSGNTDDAKQWFQQAADQYEDVEVQRAADRALLKLEMRSAAGAGVEETDFLRRFALVAVDVGEVRGLVNPDDTQGEDDSDTSVALLLAGSTTLTPVENELDWKLGGSIYTERYSTFSAYDIDGYSVFSSVNLPMGEARPELKLSASRFTIDGEPYLDQMELGIKHQWALGASKSVVVHGKLFSVNSPEDTYAYYAGQLAELGAELRGGQSPKWRVGMTWRNENRDDRVTSVSNSAGDGFESFTAYSRDWLRLRGRLGWNWTPKWRQKLEAGWRLANYHDADLYLAGADATALTSHERETARWNIKAELSRSLSPTMDLNLKVEHLEDDSNDDRYDFDSQSISAGMSYLF